MEIELPPHMEIEIPPHFPPQNGTTANRSPDGTGSTKYFCWNGISASTVAGIVIAVIILAAVVLLIWILASTGVVGIVIAVVIFVVLFIWIIFYRRRMCTVTVDIETQVAVDIETQVAKTIWESNVVFSIEVLRQATNNFSGDNILGSGGFGDVYKGELYDGTKIAVKRMKPFAMSSRGMKQFDAEIAVLTRVRHRHLVALLGYCINDKERLLAFEYMPEGTLTQHLFQRGENGCSLNWKERIIIALDVAHGVQYLHSLAPQSFIHRDLKPSNILLGHDKRAKVADFGLVKNLPDGKHSVYTQLAGTFGYFAPEYTATGKVTTKVDVYAFGVVLMELITGRKALDQTLSEERCQLVPWFRQTLTNKENIPNAIDQTLKPDKETMESIYKVVKLAIDCTTHKLNKRPNMGHVVNMLSPLVEQWKPISDDEEEDTYGVDQYANSVSLTLER